jgi:hypothetical protein
MLVKMLLQLLVGQIDAKLLQVVESKALKSVNVQQSYAGEAARVLADGGVYTGN